MTKAFSKSPVGKVTGNAIKYNVYKYIRDKYSEEQAKALFSGVLKVGDDGGKKKDKQKDQNGGG